MQTHRLRIFAIGCSVFLSAVYGCTQNNPKTQSQKPEADSKSFENATLADYRSELIDLAFNTATAIPIEPHIKDRSRSQEQVIEAALELEQPQTALDYLDRIANWRRGAAYAELALYCARHGITERVQEFLDKANEYVELARSWRKDHIRMKIARAHAWLGQTEQAQEFESQVPGDSPEVGKVAEIRAEVGDASTFDKQSAELDAIISKGVFDGVKNALYAYVALFDAHFANLELRERAQQKITEQWGPMPILLRIEMLMDLAKFAIKHGDQEKALELVNQAQQIKDEANWPLRYGIPLSARLAQLRYQSGDAEKALSDAQAAMSLYEEQGEQITNIDRAGVLRDLAEAFNIMQNQEKALQVYRMAVEAGVVNPNSRPRAEDLAATASAMAVQGVEPDEALWLRMREIFNQLGDPW